MKSQSTPCLIGLIIFIAVTTTAWVWYYRPFTTAGPHPAILMDMSDIETAINRYHVEFGTDPDTSSESLFATLNGANPRGLKFIDEKRLTNGIDPWGTPYGVFYSNNEWLIRSAGRDKIFNDQSLDGTDDIIFRIPKLRSNPAKSTPR